MTRRYGTTRRIPPARLMVLLGILFLAGSPAPAQTGVGVSPPRAELFARPGEELTRTLTIDNPASQTILNVNTYFSDVFLMPDGTAVYAEAGSNPRSVAPWAAVTPLAFDLAATGSQQVRYTISVPEGTQPGTYWAVLFFEARSPAAERLAAGPGVTSVVRVGHILYVTVGQPALAGSIAGIRYDNETASGALRVAFQNSGEGLLRLNGRAEIRSLAGELIRTLRLDGAASFPGSTHDLTLPLQEPLAQGTYVVLAVLDYGEAAVVAGEGRIEVP